MNLVQLSEQLKDVPDNFLMMEVQNPSGSYPAYLIVSEMTRRKRMRENAPKQEPQTTVAEDLMGGGIRAMQPQMPQPGAAQAMASQMPQMPAQQPQMPQAPQMMAGGGLVAFQQGGPVRAFDGLFVDPTVTPSYDGFEIPRKDLVEQMTLSELQEYNRSGKVPQRLQSQFSGATITESIGPSTVVPTVPQVVPEVTSVYPQESQRAGRGTGAIPVAPAKAPVVRDLPKQTTTSSLGAGSEALRIAQELGSTTYPGYDMEAGIARLRQTMPDTASTALADYIRRQEGQMAGQRESNLNMALMQAGLGMMGSKARSGIQGIAEGGLEGLRAYRAGMSELKKGEQQIDLARMKMAEANDARERGLYDLAMKEQATSMEMFKQGQDAKYRAGSILAAVESAQRPTGRTVDTTPSPAEVKTAQELARQTVMNQAIGSGAKFDLQSPAFIQAVEAETQRILAQAGKIYSPSPMMMGANPQNRGSFASIMGQ